MEMKHLIIFALAGFVILIGFNMMNSSRDEDNRTAVVDSNAPATVSTDATMQSAGSESIANQPLGQQPKAILDNATSKIDQAQQADKERLDQMSNAQ
ncbi:hypothetical protein [Psychrobacter sp. DAB_AL62B]|uniref:hypothetical protein n=1 Tax=Psychrobacter sp. DAB_AL62B TaxID=1028420 RepID=UPI0023811F5D|nr:hypothetical protein [Psychrobacter sp. DAB_AL62B]MDE4455772.1 hypothetical protein [Psychrobacter sp. DAB_AL62B]